MTRLNPTTKTNQTQELKNRNYPDIKDAILTNIKIDPVTSCWEWQRGKSTHGYGTIRAGGGHVYAHRLSYQLFVGPIRGELCALHRCDNPGCVNPSHIFLGSRADNNADKTEKGRSVRGACHWGSRLCDSDVVRLRALYSTGNFTQQQIGEMFGVTQTHAGKIINRKKWAWLP